MHCKFLSEHILAIPSYFVWKNFFIRSCWLGLFIRSDFVASMSIDCQTCWPHIIKSFSMLGRRLLRSLLIDSVKIKPFISCTSWSSSVILSFIMFKIFWSDISSRESPKPGMSMSIMLQFRRGLQSIL